MAGNGPYQRLLRSEAAAIGRCCVCRKRPARDGLKTCEVCGDATRKLEGLKRQALWRECCQSCDEHRFDCVQVEPHKRGKGPFGPTKPPTAADLVAALRSAS